MMDKFVIRVPKEVMFKFFGKNEEYRVECKRGACPICAYQVDGMDRYFNFDDLAKVREIALGRRHVPLSVNLA